MILHNKTVGKCQNIKESNNNKAVTTKIFYNVNSVTFPPFCFIEGDLFVLNTSQIYTVM